MALVGIKDDSWSQLWVLWSCVIWTWFTYSRWLSAALESGWKTHRKLWVNLDMTDLGHPALLLYLHVGPETEEQIGNWRISQKFSRYQTINIPWTMQRYTFHYIFALWLRFHLIENFKEWKISVKCKHATMKEMLMPMLLRLLIAAEKFWNSEGSTRHVQNNI